MSHHARTWVRDLGDHLCGPVRALLWADADRANAGDFWTSQRTQARESGLSYAQVRRLLPLLVEHKVFKVREQRAGTRPAVYRFTFRDPTGLPSALHRRAVGKELVRAREELVRANEGSSALPGRAEPEEPETTHYR